MPLITVLFFATYMLPLFLPGSWKIDALAARADRRRAVLGGLYGGGRARRLAGDPARPVRGRDGARARLLADDRSRHRLPQALKLVIPGIVNSFIALFKDTTLVLIVAIFDLLGQMRAAFADPELGDAGDAVHRLRFCRDDLFRRSASRMSRYALVHGAAAQHRSSWR